MSLNTAIAIGLAGASTTLTNIAYLREHDAAAALPALSLRRPVQSIRLLLDDRSWLFGFALETGGFLLYAAALRFGPLAVVQSIGAGGIGVLAYVGSRLSKRQLGPRHRAGVIVSMFGLVALGVSLIKANGVGGKGSTVAILVWLGGTVAVALVLLVIGRNRGNSAVAYGVAGGLLLSIGDISTKVATQGSTRAAFVITLIVGYLLGSLLVQLGYQRGAALTVAGLATLLTNALPILAGTIVLRESVPSGAFGTVRILAFLGVIVGSILLAVPEEAGSHKVGRTASVNS